MIVSYQLNGIFHEMGSLIGPKIEENGYIYFTFTQHIYMILK